MRRRLVPVLAVLTIAAVSAAVGLEARVTAASEGVDGLVLRTPVLSVRRLPEVLVAPIADRRLRADLATWAATTPPASCALVHDEAGEVVLDLRSDLPLVPASAQKLATATAALLELGADVRLRTAVVGAAPVGGAVAGDLTLVGGGDPLLATPAYAARFERQPQVFTDIGALAQGLVDAGVRRVDGSIVGDEGRYDRERYVAGWPPRYLEQDVTGPLSALSVDDGFVAFPPTWGGPGELVPAADPAVHAAAVLTAELEARGVDVAGAPRSGAAPLGASELAGIDSPPLTELVAQLLLESDNGTAELLLKEIGRLALDPSTAGGRARAVGALADAGVDLTGVELADGSGLGLGNRATCALLVELLERPGTGAVLRDGLPVAGRTGTLADRFLGTALEGHLAAKTGTLNSVASLAGVIDDGDTTFTFAYVVNETSGVLDGVATAGSQLALGEVLLSWPRAPELAALRPLDPEPEP
jgi:D-alanyl-D-alanine carboxypeptidase/D-alanyl-D-alanine-endopeptidase (penicillin-binding protein 4)